MKNLFYYFKSRKILKKMSNESEDLSFDDDILLISDVDNFDYLKKYKKTFSSDTKVRIKVMGGSGGGFGSSEGPIFINWSTIFISVVINVASSYIFKFLENIRNNKNNIKEETINLIHQVKIYDHTGWPTISLRLNGESNNGKYAEIEFFIPAKLKDDEIFDAISKIPEAFERKSKEGIYAGNSKFLYANKYKEWVEIYG